MIYIFNYTKYLIKLLKEKQKQHPVLKYFLIKTPSKQIAQSDNCIFIGFSEARATNRTHNSQNYDELIDIVITTKQQDYIESAKIYDAVTNILLNILRDDDYLKDKMKVISFMHKYNSDNTLQFGELLLSFKCTENFSKDKLENNEKLLYDIVYSIKGYSDEEANRDLKGYEDGKKERRD